MDTTKLPPVPCLSTVLGAVLALTVSGCGCRGVEDEDWRVDISEVLSGNIVNDIREANPSAGDRCAAACSQLSRSHSDRFINPDNVTSCEAEPVSMNDGDPEDPEDPWDPVYTELLITCTAEGVIEGFCTGRRPLGHREATLAIDSIGAWFAVHAHLEQAAVAAFEELGSWLQDRGAPAELIDRCRAARLDEIDHARRMSEQARRRGAEVPAVEAEPSPDELLDVALHNAVEGCVSEAFAAVLAAHQARHAGTPELRELFAALADDELRHGQLAWDLHAWMSSQLSPAQRAWVEQAQHRALARLPELARRGAEATPVGLGWPTPALAEAMARRFAELLASDRAAA
ncbi:MAG: ferritin-like domain-containing protein [Enhygromyxa sp.]